MKVEKDLDVFIESISTAEQRVRRGDTGPETQDLIRNLREMRPKIADLSIKLNAAGEYETADKATGAGKRLNIFFEDILTGGASRSGSGADPQARNDGGGFFDDFNTIGSQKQQAGFDQFNTFGSTQPQTQPPRHPTADFWSQNGQDAPVNPPPAPKTATSRNFFDEVQPDPAPKTTPNSFFDSPHFGGAPKQPVQAVQKPQVQEDMNLLGLDDPVAPPKKPAPAPQQQSAPTPLGPSFDLLGMSPARESQPTNPFASQPGPAMQTGAPGMMGLQQQQQQLLRMMQMNPLMQQQMMMNPALYQQMMMNPGASLGMGAQMSTGLGGFPGQPQQPAFGAQNKIAFQEPSRAQVPEKRQYDPFNDLASDLI